MNTKQDKKSAIQLTEGTAFVSEVLRSDLPVLVLFLALWSHPCRILASVISEVAIDCAGRWKVVEINADDNPALSLWFEIQSIPTLLFFVNGKVRAKMVGTISKEVILSRLQEVSQNGDAAPFLCPGPSKNTEEPFA